MTIDIGKPAAPDGFQKEGREGHLLIAVGHRAEEVTTAYGEATAARIAYLADYDTNEVFEDVQLFGKALAPAIFRSDAQIVPGRLVKGTAAREGQNPPWLLQEITADEMELVRGWVDEYVTQLGSGKLVVDVDGAHAPKGS